MPDLKTSIQKLKTAFKQDKKNKLFNNEQAIVSNQITIDFSLKNLSVPERTVLYILAVDLLIYFSHYEK